MRKDDRVERKWEQNCEKEQIIGNNEREWVQIYWKAILGNLKQNLSIKLISNSKSHSCLSTDSHHAVSSLLFLASWLFDNHGNHFLLLILRLHLPRSAHKLLVINRGRKKYQSNWHQLHRQVRSHSRLCSTTILTRSAQVLQYRSNVLGQGTRQNPSWRRRFRVRKY